MVVPVILYDRPTPPPSPEPYYTSQLLGLVFVYWFFILSIQFHAPRFCALSLWRPVYSTRSWISGDVLPSVSASIRVRSVPQLVSGPPGRVRGGGGKVKAAEGSAGVRVICPVMNNGLQCKIYDCSTRASKTLLCHYFWHRNPYTNTSQSVLYNALYYVYSRYQRVIR